jgi:hypothetical protein
LAFVVAAAPAAKKASSMPVAMTCIMYRFIEVLHSNRQPVPGRAERQRPSKRWMRAPVEKPLVWRVQGMRKTAGKVRDLPDMQTRPGGWGCAVKAI